MSSFYSDPNVGGDGSTTTDDASATTGLQNYGWTTRLVPALAQVVAVAAWVKNTAINVLGWSNSASASATAAATAATTATLRATDAGNYANAAAVSAAAATTTPLATTAPTSIGGTGNVGTGNAAARADHSHAGDAYPISNPANWYL